ncbi:MAG: 16S rRNA (cytosine(967)-C(5))-methyltransferase [Cyanobacteria bacterium WB6_1B_304]|nr:16S rRNA (cytosine(967)-C(5))-methyltransferase [Cyanobacteria bacterium WB6_1B_304]
MVLFRHSARQLAIYALQAIAGGTYTDIALDRVLSQPTQKPSPSSGLTLVDRRFTTQLVYGTVRHQRTLDALIDQLAQKAPSQQPPVLRIILRLGLYQLRYLTQVPPSAAVDTTVELTKINGLGGLAGFTNGLLRHYIRLTKTSQDPLQLPTNLVQRLGLLHSFPDWMIEIWLEQLGEEETGRLCHWFNQPPILDLRVNPLHSSLTSAIVDITAALKACGLRVQPNPFAPQALRLYPRYYTRDGEGGNPVGDPPIKQGDDDSGIGSIPDLPGYGEGKWIVQESSAQIVSHLLDPQPGELIIDACAAPGGKTTHIAELMHNQGQVWGYDLHPSRLKKISENAKRLGVTCIHLQKGDSCGLSNFVGQADRVLVDAPCSGLGTLHRHADARWRQSPATIEELTTLQLQLLRNSSTWVKPGGILVYATCTLNPMENQRVIEQFLQSAAPLHLDEPLPSKPSWVVEPPPVPWFQMTEGWGYVTIWPHRYQMDGFFVARLRRVN